MQVGDIFEVTWYGSVHKCRIIDINPKEDEHCPMYTVDLLKQDSLVFRTYFFSDMLTQLKKQTGPTWSCKPRYPKRSSV